MIVRYALTDVLALDDLGDARKVCLDHSLAPDDLVVHDLELQGDPVLLAAGYPWANVKGDTGVDGTHALDLVDPVAVD